jgi:hypothetical protein
MVGSTPRAACFGVGASWLGAPVVTPGPGGRPGSWPGRCRALPSDGG